jgi:DNA-binding transcriptional LysR family regulator
MNTLLGNLDWSALRHFYAVAHHQGFSRAAREIRTSQPALSTAVKKLESVLETPLIVRGTGEFRLTPEGSAVYDFCRHLEGNVSALLRELRGNGAGGTERFRIGTALSIGYGPLAGLLERLTEREGAVDIEAISADSHRLLELLHDGKIDAACLPEDVHSQGLRFATIAKDEVILVGGPKISGNFTGETWRSKLGKIPLITYTRDTPMRILVDGICQRGKIPFVSMITVASVEAVKTIAARGVGVAFMQRSLAAGELASGTLREIQTPLTLPKRAIHLATRGSEANFAKRLLELLRES